jgi:hypothetical protein
VGFSVKGATKAGKHVRPVGSKILPRDIEEVWAEAGSRLDSHMVYEVARTRRCTVCVDSPPSLRVEVVTRFTFGHVQKHEVETVVHNCNTHATDPGDNPELKAGTPTDRKTN